MITKKRSAKVKKYFLFLIFALIMSLGLPYSEAASEIIVNINGQPLQTDVAPVTIQGRTMVPIRAIFEALGADVKWDSDTEKITGTKGNTVIVLHLGKDLALINGELKYLDVPPTLINGRTMVPTRFIAESLGAEVRWDNDTRTVNIVLASVLDAEKIVTEKSVPLTAREVIELIEPTTVLIETHRGQGSGFFISRDGQIATNAHVVRGSRYINITTFDGKKYSADIFKINNAADLAIIKINAHTNFPYISQYCYIKDVCLGDDIFAFGNPLGLTNTVTRGIVSAKREWSPSEAWTYKPVVIQHDATIAPGSSGGPVVNLYGELIGVNFSGYLLKDISFAIPYDDLYWLIMSQNTYGLKSDFDCYLTENWEWIEAHKKISNMYTEIQNSGPVGSTVRLNLWNEKQTLLENLIQQVASYYPKYPEINNLKQLLLNYLNANYELNTFFLQSEININYFSDYKARSLMEKTEEAGNLYFNTFNTINSRYYP